MDEHNILPDLELNGRMVINVGFCKNEGCSDWKTFEDPDLIYPVGLARHEICSGVNIVYLPGNQSPVMINHFSKTDKTCENPVNFDVTTVDSGFRGVSFSVDSNDEMNAEYSMMGGALQPISFSSKEKTNFLSTNMTFVEKENHYDLQMFSSVGFYTPTCQS